MRIPNSDTEHDSLILDSWDRCRSFGLEHDSQPGLQQLGSSECKVLREEHNSLVHTTGQEVLPFYENILSNSKCMILLTDCRGQVLNGWGDQRFVGQRQKAFFQQGTSWLEKTHGTNAIGTAIASGQAVQVQRDEHFLKANRFMIGSAAPIFDVNRDLLGVLDVSSDAYLPQAHTLGMVKLMSQSVENRLIINTFGAEHFLLTFNTNLDNLDSQWSGLLVFNEEGTIISANRRAELLLGYDLALVSISQLFDCPLRELKNQPELQPLQLRTPGQHHMYGVVKRPIERVIQAVDFRQHKADGNSTPPGSPSGDNRTAPTAGNGVIGLDQIGYGDARVDRCVRQAERIIEKDIPILIHGETGVGKEVFVKALHQHSSRSRFALVAVNCAAIPGELVESELFGYEKGAFTGASNKGAIGLIRKAHKGTLFLDEIGEMPLQAQARLLRVLQERKVTPLGSTESYPVDIKLVSATNRCLRSQVQEGLFRQDLYYRVTGLNIELPPLRERTDRRNLFQQVHLMHRDPSQSAPLSEELLNLFDQHPWPGNIRQLISVLQIALAMADEDAIEPWHLPDDFFQDIEQQRNALPEPTGSAPVNTLTTRTLPEKEAAPWPASTAAAPAQDATSTDETLAAYSLHEGNISRTAKALGISRNTLYKRLRDLGLRQS
ncbi:sigma-54-dependent Fis family transcriptional regulator [Marinobacterium aestuarii]|uniref:Sigma-54-dependent Fis family transcriptional regulator n=1 Tax=Marinobacterium aestuarii TaxID=1821621 RepID=A0A1A9EXL3_9GAMM|nr:sigma-54-dependent Fis family transcriptional regulator [Marinobacterium aestuarii]ANG62263.1 sigma-54-dependent Fis family transcriptional regulator [Marinobacterium aestuarii]